MFEPLIKPIIQGGMGIGISLGNLAGAVMAEGGMGVISAAHPGYREPDFWQNSCEANCRALQKEVQKARVRSQGKGLLAINIMSISTDYVKYVKASVKAKVDAIISGAGLPLSLPKWVPHDILLAPIVSSGKACDLICKVWEKRYHRLPDFVVIEGYQAGGHLGFDQEDLQADTCPSNVKILQDVLTVLGTYDDTIPVFVAGGIYDRDDIEAIRKQGAYGVQLGTRFIATYECDAHIRFKQAVIQCKKADIRIIKSPTGFPGRALNTPFVQNHTGYMSVTHCLHCLRSCDPQHTPYCISRALINAVKGDIEHGVVFVSAQADRIDHIVSVHELMEELL
ncbi:nitronate monooxygenase family protein [Absicoccus porci]|uniref:NAD(P)H-dependent flavin oxidoreductase n=1 Tax=Absicoccus porci TaxID=2486576 RepID=UPI00156A2140|nr:nitronate monooxygenase family protein [Absicoccus porci]MEE1355760.1 nitronate monooxygenase family protein [Absicoccus porci]